MTSTIKPQPIIQRYRWDVHERAPTEYLKSFAGVHPLLVQLLWNRGMVDPQSVEAFLGAAGEPLGSPWSLSGMADAVDRLLDARARGEAVTVYGDYDVDGVSSTVLLVECLRLAEIRVAPFVPRRNVEGYGLNGEALERLRDAGTRLVVAVDCGISGAREVERAKTIGLDVIVVDHHHAPAVLPRAVAVINPKQPGCAYPFKDLCAAGLAYRLAQALFERLGQGPEVADRWLDLVALATVADVVPLTSENRGLVQRGLPYLNPPRRVGLRALATRAGLRPGAIGSRALAFVLAPRLNAAGRLAGAGTSVQLLLSESAEESAELVETLESTNRERQRLTGEALERACAAVRSLPDLPRLLLVADESFAAGVVGLVAARLVEQFHRPAFVAEVGDGLARGSARGIEGFHIAEALASCSDVLVRHGGHARAAGFTVETNRLDELRARLQAIAGEQISDRAIEASLSIDAEVRLARLDSRPDLLLDRLEPCGFGNPTPLFLSRQLQVLSARVVGSSPPGHLKLKVRDGATSWDAIGFGMGGLRDNLADRVDLVYSIDRHEWNGAVSAQLCLRDLCPSDA
ncbi:MAG: single-stranded-DNA-specific exonuclease RecJ [Chloroflexota bacterium]